MNTKSSSAISGFADYDERQGREFHAWIQKLWDVFANSGFSPFFPRPVERAVDLVKKGGITGQIFSLGRLQDGTMTELALPFDRTVPLALWVDRNAQNVLFPFKRADISHSWRGEHAQKGRFRAFIQADIDIIGRNLSPLSDADCIATTLRALHSLDIGSFTLSINHMELSRFLLQSLRPQESQVPALLRIIDKMDKLSSHEMIKELASLVPHNSEEEIKTFLQKLRFKGPLSEFPLGELSDPRALAAHKNLQEVLELLARAGVDMNKVSFCPSMVRGLNYYTGVVFETFLDHLPKSGSIASGGRYNNLIESVSDLVTPAVQGLEGVGFSIGLTRIFDLINKTIVPMPPAQVLVLCRADAEKDFLFQQLAMTIASQLRCRGVSADLYTSQGHKFKDLLSYASGKGYPLVVSIMSEESFVVRDMNSREQNDVPSMEEAIQIVLAHSSVVRSEPST